MRQVHYFPDGTQLTWNPTLQLSVGIHRLHVDCHCGPWCKTDVDEGVQTVRHVEPNPV